MRDGLRLLVLVLGVLIASPAWAGSSNSLMDISADGQLLACSNRDNGSVTIVDLNSRRPVCEIHVGKKPEGVTFLGPSHSLAIAVYAEDKIVLLDADSQQRTSEIEVFDEPYGLVSTADGTKLYATLEYPGQVVEIDVLTSSIVRTIEAGKFLRGLALSPDETRVYVTEYLTALVRSVDLASGEIVDEWAGASTDNLARQITAHPRRPKLYLPHMRSRVSAAHGEGSIFPYVAIVDTRPERDRRRTRIPMDSFRGALVTANPWEVAVSPDGTRLCAVFSGTNDIFVCDVVDDDYRELTYRFYRTVGRNPRAVRVAPDGRTFYIYNALDFNVVAYDAETFEPTATIPVCENPLSDEVLQGKILFYSALQPMVGRRWISCSSCHPDGDADGRTWQNPEGLRNTQSLAGMAWTHPIHWSADRDEVQDFEHTIRGELMQGRGLIKGDLEPSLSANPNKGLSDALDALAAYSNTHEFPFSPHAKNGLSEAAKRGREVFLSSETGCAKCHSGPLYTDSRPDREFAVHDVGTGNDDPSEKMGPKYDTPTLLGVYRTAPYLHHGKAATLEEVLTKYNPDDRHGRTSHLSAEQIADLVEFLKALPYEDAAEQARAAGLPRIDR